MKFTPFNPSPTPSLQFSLQSQTTTFTHISNNALFHIQLDIFNSLGFDVHTFYVHKYISKRKQTKLKLNGLKGSFIWFSFFNV